MKVTIQALSASDQIAKSIAKLKADDLTKLFQLLELVGITTIAYLRSLTNEMRPPTRADKPARRAHPGHWADDKGQLANSYSWEVFARGSEEVVLALRNSADYAAFVEARDGFFVLSGVVEPGGVVEQAIKKALPVVAPGWAWRLA